MELEEALERIKPILTPGRYAHTIRVLDTSLKFARKWGADQKLVALTAALHDCAKNISEELMPVYGPMLGDFARYPAVRHAPLGAFYARDVFKIRDCRILEGICYHCTGRPAMPLEEKIVYLADALEPGRNYDGVERLRLLPEKSLDLAVREYARSNLSYLSGQGGCIHPLSERTREYYEKLLEGKYE